MRKYPCLSFLLLAALLGCGCLQVQGARFRVPEGPPGQESERPPGFVPASILVQMPPMQEAELGPSLSLEPPVERFFFVQESLEQVLKFLSDLTGKRILTPENLPRATITFDSQGPLPKDEAIVAIESLLQMNGISIAEMGDTFIRVMPANAVRFRAPSFIHGTSVGMQPSERIYTKVFKLNFLRLEDGATVMGNLLTQGVGYIEQLKSSNAIMVTDTLVNIQRIEQILESIDVYSDKVLIFRKLSNVKASEVQQRIQAAAEGSIQGFLSGNISIEADDRTNQLIIVTESANRDVIEELIRSYDEVSMPSTATEVIYLKHAEAEKVVSIVNSLISGQKENARERTSPTVRDTPGAQPEVGPSTLPNDGDIASTDLSQFSEFLAIEADERSNAILVYGTRADVASVKSLISNLDVLLPQVKIDVVITEVTMTDGSSRGIDRFGITYNEDDEIELNINENSDLPISISGGISNVILRSFGATDFTLATVFSTARQDSNVRVISAPTLVTTHNREAVINAGESRPVITASNTDSTGQSTRSQVDFKDIGVQLKVKPLIGSNGMVQMEVHQTVESVVSEVTIDGNSQPVIGKREATSFVSVASGSVVVLGGLQERTRRTSEGRTGFWGSIPIVGRLLFSSNRDSNSVRELIIFIKPTVFSSSDDASAFSLKKMERLETDVTDEIPDFFPDSVGQGDETKLDMDANESQEEAIDPFSNRFRRGRFR